MISTLDAFSTLIAYSISFALIVKPSMTTSSAVTLIAILSNVAFSPSNLMERFILILSVFLLEITPSNTNSSHWTSSLKLPSSSKNFSNVSLVTIFATSNETVVDLLVYLSSPE